MVKQEDRESAHCAGDAFPYTILRHPPPTTSHTLRRFLPLASYLLGTQATNQLRQAPRFAFPLAALGDALPRPGGKEELARHHHTASLHPQKSRFSQPVHTLPPTPRI